MNNPLKNQIKIQISQLKETPFENFITELVLKYYGPDGFIPTREKSDEGCDGIIVSKKEVIACYGPVKYEKKSFDKKAEDDFASYKKNWEKDYPNWRMIVNHDPAPNEIKKVGKLKSGSKIWGIQNIIQIIEDQLTSKQKRDIAKYLGIDKEIIAMDYIKEILDDLLNNNKSNNDIEYNKPIYLLDKVKLNFEDDEIDDFNELYQGFIADGTLFYIKGIIQGYSEGEINQIKVRIKNDFNNQKKNSFKDGLGNLTNQYKMKYSSENDDEYNYYIKAIIVYCFEQCIIGKKTPQENDKCTPR